MVEFPVFGSESLAAVAKGENDLLPDQFSLNQNYPNPFNPTTNISFNLPTASDVTIKNPKRVREDALLEKIEETQKLRNELLSVKKMARERSRTVAS